MHARKAWLKGLSPKENRTIPPLDYPRVYRLAARLAPFALSINGGIETLGAAESHLDHVAGVMLGRAAYQTPAILADVDARIFGEPSRDIGAAKAMNIKMYGVRTGVGFADAQPDALFDGVLEAVTAAVAAP